MNRVVHANDEQPIAFDVETGSPEGVTTGRATWTNAEDLCGSIPFSDGHLATIEWSGANDFVRELLQVAKSNDAWIGRRRGKSLPDGFPSWSWTSDSTAKFSYATQNTPARTQGVQHIRGAAQSLLHFEWAVTPNGNSEEKDYVCSFPKHTCPANTLHHDGSCYWTIETPKRFLPAGATCAKTAAAYNASGSLASIHTTDQFKFVADMLGNKGLGWQGDGKGAWIGLNVSQQCCVLKKPH